MKRAPGHARLARFQPTKAEPEHTVGLPSDHPAVVEGRTLFRNRVSPTEGSMRFLVSGANNAKIGKAVEKGPWAGMPIFTLTLEERKTCPRSCAMWRDCYGNAMQWSPRWDHTDPAFLPTLQAEIITLGRANPKGFVVRLHVLGDFFSVRYVYFWAEMLAVVPSLHVYGYTARTVLDVDPESARIARALAVLTDNLWSRFAVRTSGGDPEFSDVRATVVDTPEEAKERGAILCPSQTSATETCGTCALCWSENARGRTIAFLRHGMKRPSGPRAVAGSRLAASEDAPAPFKRQETGRAGADARVSLPARRDPGAVAAGHAKDEARLIEALRSLGAEKAEVEASLKVLAEASSIPHGSVLFVIRRLAGAGRIAINTQQRLKGARKPNRYRILGTQEPTPKYAPPHAQPSPELKSQPPKIVRAPLAQDAILPAEPLKPARSRYVGDLPPAAAPAPQPVVAESDGEAFEAPVLGARPNSILALGYRACRWPTNSPPPGRGDLTTFCCAQTEGETYCRKHAAAAKAGPGREWTPEQRAARPGAAA